MQWQVREQPNVIGRVTKMEASRERARKRERERKK